MNTMVLSKQRLRQAKSFAEHLDRKTAIVLNCCEVIFRPGAVEIYPKNRQVLGAIYRNVSIQDNLVDAAQALRCRCIVSYPQAGTWELAKSD